jgi:4-methylaminobutanoate oxidase (formaldehyde-forming)
MQDSAHVVIIGGGIVGCSTAYHLTKMGWKDVVLIDKGELTSGSTWHAAGLVGQLRSERNITRMLQYSVSLYDQLEAETGFATGWKMSGCLHLASTKERMYELKKGATTARSFGLEMNIITPQEAYDLCPIISLDGIIGAAFMPTDGEADPSGITQALAQGARSRGAKIYRNNLVTGFEFDKNRATTVKTEQGDIKCEILVNCTGMWGYQVGQMLGINIPVVPFMHQYAVTNPIKDLPPKLPTIRDKDNLIYYKEEVGGLIMGGYERNGIPWAVDGVSNKFNSNLLDSNFDHFLQLAEPATKRTPCLEDAGIRKLVNGPEGFTPDGDAIMGPAPEKDNVFVAVGFNAFGIAAGGGAGRMMAEWIIGGEPSLDIWPLDIRRFGGYHSSRRYCVKRTRELYGKHYTIHWPNEEHGSARGVRRSPLYPLLKQKGAVYGAKYGWERANWFAPEGVEPKDVHTFELPNWFQYVAAEHKTAREQVVLIDQTSFSKFEVEGPEALVLMNHLCANQIDQPVGKVVYTQMCNERGTVECDVTVGRLAEKRFLVVAGTAFGRRVSWWIESHMPQNGTVFFKDVTSAYAVLNVIGPKSRDLLQKTTGEDLSNSGFAFGTCKSFSVEYAPVIAFRMTYVGELGYELYIPTEYAANVYETLWESGQDLGVKNAGYRTISSMHLEKGYPDWGSELTPEYTPFDAGLGFCVALDKVDFIGKSALMKIKKNSPQWKLCTFTIDADRPVMMQSSAPILLDGQVAGNATSAGYGHTVGKTICFSYIAADKTDLNGNWEIETYKKIYPAILEPNRALYDPSRKKIFA